MEAEKTKVQANTKRKNPDMESSIFPTYVYQFNTQDIDIAFLETMLNIAMPKMKEYQIKTNSYYGDNEDKNKSFIDCWKKRMDKSQHDVLNW